MASVGVAVYLPAFRTNYKKMIRPVFPYCKIYKSFLLHLQFLSFNVKKSPFFNIRKTFFLYALCTYSNLICSIPSSWYAPVSRSNRPVDKRGGGDTMNEALIEAIKEKLGQISEDDLKVLLVIVRDMSK